MTKSDYLIAFRAFLQDDAQNNIISEYMQQNTDDQLWMFLNFALMNVNMVPPPVMIYNTVESYCYPPLLILFATQWALNSQSIKETRNDLAYNNGGVNVKFEDAQRWLNQIQLINTLINQLSEGYRLFKISYNIMAAFGGVESPYSLLHGRFGSLIPTSLFATGGATYGTQG